MRLNLTVGALLVLLGLSACTGADPSTPAGGGGGGDDDGDDGGGGGGGDDTGTERLQVDQEAFQLLLDEGAGEDLDAVLTGIANNSGFPLPAPDGGYWFACRCQGDGWMLAGDHEGWSGQPMTQQGELWWILADVPDPDGSLYKFTDGSAWTADPLARRYGYDEYGEFSLVEASAAHLERKVDVGGYGLEGRELRIWVPTSGSFTHTLYAHDGQNLFDPEAIWGGWHLQDSLPDDVLVVGIDNTAARMEEYTHTTDTLYGDEYGGWGDDYADLVELQIRPMIEGLYGEPEVVGVLGSSLGGLISLHIASRHEGAYDFAASMSGTLSWGSFEQHNPTIIELYEDAGHRSTAVFLDSGGYGDCVDTDADGLLDDGEGADNYCPTLQMASTLEAAGYAWEQDLWHWHEPNAEHNEAEWAARVWRPLEVFKSL